MNHPKSLTRVVRPDSQDTAAGPYYQRRRGQGDVFGASIAPLVLLFKAAMPAALAMRAMHATRATL